MNLCGILCFIPGGFENLFIRFLDTNTGLSGSGSLEGDCVITQCMALDNGDTGTSTFRVELLAL